MCRFTYSIGALLFATLFAACGVIDSKTSTQAQKSTPTPTPHSDGARRITIAEFEALQKEGKVFVVDVRSQDAYDIGHIPGSKLIPSHEIANRSNELPKDKLIVTYCSWHDEHTSAGAVVALKKKGIENAAALLGGFNLWRQQNKPVERKQ